MTGSLRAIGGLAVLTATLFAVPASAGPAGFAFLEVPAGARASALGGAFTSLGQGVEAAFWNPAGLAHTHGLQMTGAHFELIDGLRHSQVAVAGGVLGGGLSGSLRAFYTEPIEERDALGNLIGTFGSHDLEFALGYGVPLTSGLDIGVTSQVVRERIANSSATTYAFGAGAQWTPAQSSNTRIGLQVANLGPATHYDIDGVQGADVSLPAAVQGGMSYAHAVGLGMSLRGVLEARFTTGRSGIGMLGAELESAAGAALRAGFRANDDAQNVSYGVGYAREGLHLDYAFVPYRYELGDTHRIAFTVQF
jgi:hypothetical protein